MRKEEKIRDIEKLSERLDKAKALIFAEYRGLKVSEMNDLRSKLRQADSSLKVVRNRLMKRALAEHNLDELSAYLEGPTAMATSDFDPAAPAKVLVDFAKGHERLVLKGGLLEGAKLERADVESIARLPSRDELLARSFASLMAPASNLVGVLAAMPRKLVYALNAIKDTKQ